MEWKNNNIINPSKGVPSYNDLQNLPPDENYLGTISKQLEMTADQLFIIRDRLLKLKDKLIGTSPQAQPQESSPAIRTAGIIGEIQHVVNGNMNITNDILSLICMLEKL